jgi:hypothetical protein
MDDFTGIMIFVAAVIAAVTPFLTCWPWKWFDRRKINRFMAENGDKVLGVKGHFWARWERVKMWTWIPVRRYTVSYVGPDGSRHRVTATCYLPWWLNKGYDSELVGNFDFVGENDDSEAGK